MPIFDSMPINSKEAITNSGFQKYARPVPTYPSVNPPDSWFRRKRINARMGQAEQAIKEIAARQDCAVWDIYAAMGGKGSSTKWLREKLICFWPPSISPLPGYQLQGDLLCNALWSAFDDISTSRRKTTIRCCRSACRNIISTYNLQTEPTKMQQQIWILHQATKHPACWHHIRSLSAQNSDIFQRNQFFHQIPIFFTKSQYFFVKIGYKKAFVPNHFQRTDIGYPNSYTKNQTGILNSDAVF